MPTRYNSFTSNFDIVADDASLVAGPGVSTDNAIARFDGTSGTVIQNSRATISDAGLLTADELNLVTQLGVTYGGTGLTSATEYAVICGGTTTTSALQSVASVGSSGQVLTSNGAGALPTFQDAASITIPLPETDGGTGQTTYSQGDILYSDATDSLTVLPAAQCPNVLFMDDSGNPSWSDDISYFYDDFFYLSSSSQIYWPWRPNASGAGSTKATTAGTSSHPGIWRGETGTTSSGRFSLSLNDNQVGHTVVGGGVIINDWIFQLSDLSDASDEYEFGIGFSERWSIFFAVLQNNMIALHYDRTTSTDWRGICRSGGSETVASGGSSVAVATGWHHGRIVINADASSVEFFIDGTSLGTCTTNIPSDDMGLGTLMWKSAGTNSRYADIDCCRFYQKLTTSRFST